MLGILCPPVGRLRRAARPSWACLALVCVLAAPARADDLEERTQDAIDALRTGNVSGALVVLNDRGVADELVQRPALVHVLCDRAYRLDGACRDAPGADRIQLSADLLRLASATHDAAPEDVRGLWALAHATVLRERTGPAEGPAAWLRAAELLEAAHTAHPASGEALGYAVTFVLEGAVLEPDDQHALQKRAAALARSARRAHPDSLVLATTIASAHTWASRMLVEKNRRAAKAALQTSFDALRPFVERDLPMADAAALWNDAVTLDATSGFALREGYMMAPSRALLGDIVFRVPISPRWTVTEVPETEEYGAYVYVTQADASGNPVRQLLFRRYTWGMRYPFVGPNDVNGDNVKKIAAGLQAVSAERLFAVGAKKTAVRKIKVGEEFSGSGFRVSGNAAEDADAPLTVVGYCVRGAHQESFGFLVYVYGADGEVGPEMQAVLDTLEEFDG